LLKWIRGARIDLKTGLVIIGLALAVWAVVIFVNLRDFVPEEFTEERVPAPPTTPPQPVNTPR
jgi:hypothetical protein